MLQISLNKSYQKKNQPNKIQITSWIKQSIVYDYKNIIINVSIVTIDDIKSLNLEYRHKNTPTNVISLQYNTINGDDYFLTGEIILCHEIIELESINQNKNILDHYCHMVIHSTLHLQGFDHIDDLEAQEMEELEIEILAKNNIKNPYEVL